MFSGRATRETDLLPFLSGPSSEPIPVDARKPCETCSTALSPKGLGSGTERLSNSGTVRSCMLGVTRSRRSILLAESTLGPDARARDGAAARLRAAGECALAPQSWLSGAYLRRLWGSSPPRRASRHGVVARRGVRLWIKVQSANTGGSLSHGGLKIRATPSGRPALGSSSPLLVLAAHLCS